MNGVNEISSISIMVEVGTAVTGEKELSNMPERKRKAVRFNKSPTAKILPESFPQKPGFVLQVDLEGWSGLLAGDIDHNFKKVAKRLPISVVSFPFGVVIPRLSWGSKKNADGRFYASTGRNNGLRTGSTQGIPLEHTQRIRIIPVAGA